MKTICTADRWDIFVEPIIPEVDITGPGAIRIGSEFTIDINITFDGEPYSREDLDTIILLIFDENNRLVETLDAVYVGEGYYQVEVGEEITSRLASGTTLVEAVVTSRLVALPSMESLSIVTFRSGN